jgi:hypothetical protein
MGYEMKDIRHFMIGMAALIMFTVPSCDLLVPATVNQSITATERKLIVLIDLTGSMTAIRPGDLINPNRFEAAKSTARDDLIALAGDPILSLTGVRVFVFHNNGITEQIPPNPDPVTEENPDPDGDGWFAPDPVRRLIGGLPGPTGLTPLAGSMCDAADQFAGLPVDTAKTLATYSDGGENNTSPLNTCFDLDTATWQTKVQNHLLNAGVAFNGVLFTDVSSLAAPSRTDPEAAELTKLGRAPAPALSGLSDEEFFASLAMATGGTLRVIRDDKPVPVFADVSGDSAVDRTDAILLARQFGQPADPKFDLNNDGVIDFNDYRIVVSRLGVGGGQPDPYVSREPVVCNTSDRVVIDGQAIESAGITIAAHGACRVTIKNSLIVSGQSAITIVGAAQVTVDNSIIVGEDTVITLRGVARLSAANSIFHGKTDVRGQIKLTDRGGNLFE